ncbi:hypothetical protein J437_LFUL009231 [Ladona fulva]|uniref:Chitin-binding type-2 domain-containing protein n=1 Tax=Ladona fulva TaxID=123851 RepID=A0A8K0P0P8_LADFU|nr:hypothetical protein J437_LFUL009231 [Ladona fulva]
MGGKSLVIIFLAITLTFAKDKSLNGCSSGVCSGHTKGATIVQNPNDCGSFCICACGDGIMMNCSRGLEYNAVTKQCDYPSKANCSIPIPPPTPNGCDTWDSFCASAPSGTLKPNPGDCGSFCECAPGGPVKMDCPAGLHFSVAANRCERPSDAGCIPGPPPTSGPGPTPPPTPPPSGDCDAVAADCKVSPVGTLLRNPNCKVSPVGTLLRNPSDCGSFCQCAAWGPVKMDCPAGLHFSVAANRCEWPNIAGCIPGTPPTSGPGPTHPPTPPPSGDCDAVAATCNVSPVGTLLRNPSDCGSFCQCAAWGPVKMDCPAGLHFSVTTNRCEAPYDAKCM